MGGSGLWGLGAVAWLWVGGAGAEAPVRPVENREAVRQPVKMATAAMQVPQVTEQAVRFASAPVASASSAVASKQRGDPSWRTGRPASPGELQVTPSTQAALAGEQISVKVATRDGAAVRAEVFRLGVYGGTGALKVWSGGPYTVSTASRCSSPSCPERQTFSFEVAHHWEPGLYMVKVTRADGTRSFTSIVVKAPQSDGPNS